MPGAGRQDTYQVPVLVVLVLLGTQSWVDLRSTSPPLNLKGGELSCAAAWRLACRVGRDGTVRDVPSELLLIGSAGMDVFFRRTCISFAHPRSSPFERGAYYG
jgi:hypothetical protein